MGHSTIKFAPGANTNETLALNQAGVSTTQLVRFTYDPQQGALVQKLGGWTKFYSLATPAVTRALWAWADTANASHLAYGTQTKVSSTAQLGVITGGTATDITPRSATSSISAAAVSIAGNSIITITDATTTNITFYDTVFITTHIAIGGVVLFGFYACDPNGYISGTAYTVQATDTLGNAKLATASSSSPVLPLLTTVSGNPSVQVTLPNHGYTTDSQFPVLVSTTVGGSTFFGHFQVQTVIDANNFTITAVSTPSSSTTGYINGNLAKYIYSFGGGAIPAGTGYGTGGYGSGGYGSGTAVTPTLGTAIDATDWTLDNWGRILVATPIRNGTGPQFQPIYVWDVESGAPLATAIPQAPTVSDGIFVAMPQRQIVAWGTTFDGIQDPLLMRWCDVGNYNSWIGTVTNQAGSYRLATGSRIVGALQVSQQGMVWTDIGLWSMQYVGPPYVYSLTNIGTGCGLIGRKAMAQLGDQIFWMGPLQFFTMGGEGITPLPCPVWDAVYQNLDTTNVSKIRCATNSLFNEVTWYYPTLTSSGEVAAYVKYNTQLKVWDFGALARSAWIDQSVLGPPIGADPSSLYLYQHETSPDADGQPMLSSFQSGYATISDGDQMMFVDQVWPDMRWGYYSQTQNAMVNLTFTVTDYPGDTPKTFGPYPMTQSTQYLSPRFRGRLVSVALSSSDTGSFWRIGAMRYRSKADGSF